MLAGIGSVARVEAATFAVDRPDDVPAASACDDLVAGDCSLRGAITAANALAERSTISVPAGHYVLTEPSSCFFHVSPDPFNTVTFSTLALCIARSLTLAGAGAVDTIIDAGQTPGAPNVVAPVFVVSSGIAVEMRAVTVTKGNFNAGSLFGHGGGIRNAGALTLVDTIVSDSYSLGGGGGVYNTGSLTVIRGVLTRNVSPQDGGAVFNTGGGTVGLFDTVVSDNAGFNGGGISNFSGTVQVTGSTLVGNAAAQGGGAENGSGDSFTLTNTTVSGNRARIGGGLFNSQVASMFLRNVTVTDNTAVWLEDPSRGVGGGVATSDNALLSVRNSIIAGNVAGQASPDCSTARSTLTSEGYNLLGDTSLCAITGDTTGNVVGQDPRLGSLADNGGATPTHALLPDSPAVDAGHPGPPGSGAGTCAPTDQRGFVRPVGAACDVGAFERLAEFAAERVLPVRGGNGGPVLARIAGSGFEPGVTVRLRRDGQPDVVGAPVTVDGGGSAIATSFDLSGATTGPWDVVVTNPDDETAMLAGAFRVEEARAPELWVQVVGPRAIRLGLPALFTIAYGNTGNVDALAVPLSLSLPVGMSYRFLFPLATPPSHDGQLSPDWILQPVDVETGANGATNIPLLLPIVPAGFSGTLPILLTLPAGAPHGAEFTTLAALGEPLLAPAPITALVAGARAYAQATFDLALPDALAPALVAYAETQLAAVVEAGRGRLLDGSGERWIAYPLPWLQIDVALFGAEETFAAGPTAGATFRALFAPAEAAAQQQTCPVTACKGAVLAPGCSCTDVKCDQAGSKGTSVDPGCYPPPIPSPPGCELTGQLTREQFLANLKNCRMTKDHCESLPNHHVVTNDDGSTFCVPNDSSKHCPKVSIPNPLGAGSLDCIGTPIRLAADPNDKSGPAGIGDDHFVVPGTPLGYTIHFENDPLQANAPSQVVVVTDQLDATKVDLVTFSLGTMTFGDVIVPVAPGVQQYSGGVDLRPGRNLLVLIAAGLDSQTGLVAWQFTSVDPDTQQPTTDPDAGFLPPNHVPPEGDGSVSFSVQPKSGIASGSQICNDASIVFDANAPIATPEWCNGIDTAPPSSVVLPLDATTPSPSFPIEWQGVDGGAGIGDYSVLVSTDGGPFLPFLTDTTDTTIVVTGEPGHAYAFYSVARDLLGNTEAAPTVPDARIVVLGPEGPRDLAVTKITVPKTVTVRGAKPPASKTITVQIQNRGAHTETIADLTALAALVRVDVQSLDLCAPPAVTLRAPRKLPIVLKSKKTLNVVYAATFACANDPRKRTAAAPDADDYRVSAVVDLRALGGSDVHPVDDRCPRQVAPRFVIDPFPDGSIRDKGCGVKQPDKTFGAPVTVDVVVK